MKLLKSHFWYNKNQRNGILFLIALILILQLIYVFVDFSDKENIINNNDIALHQKHIDSLKTVQQENKKTTIYTFNPNYITDFKGYQLGMNIEEIDKLLAYRKSGKFVNSTIEFQEVTQISDSLLLEISPLFKFPEWVNKSTKYIQSMSKIKAKQVINLIKKDINTATAKDLQSINGIGEKLSKRIISYRDLLQGFSFNDQLFEVYYLDKEIADKVLSLFEIKQKPTIQKLNLNQASFKEVLHLPYIDYKLTKKIFNYRNEVEEILSLYELKEIDSFPLDKFNRITLYLTVE